jgi:mono/diheme cytochrome c family protein
MQCDVIGEKAMHRPPMTKSVLLLGAVLATSGAANAAQLSGDPIAGEALARSWCAECHETAAGLHGPGALNAPAFQDVADDRAVTALALRAFLQTPHADMPNVMLTPAETDDVISYILSLRGR